MFIYVEYQNYAKYFEFSLNIFLITLKVYSTDMEVLPTLLGDIFSLVVTNTKKADGILK